MGDPAGFIRFLFIDIYGIPKNQQRILFLILFLLAITVFSLLGYRYGPLLTSDGVRDHQLAVLFISVDFNIAKFIAEASLLQDGFEMPQSVLTYLVYYFVLAICILAAGSDWPAALIFLNILAYTSTLALCMGLAASIGRTVFSVILVTVLFVASWDFIQWLTMTQSDSLFCLFATLVLTLATCGLGMDRPKASVWLVACGLVAISAVFVKPTALPLLAFASFTAVVAISIRVSRSTRRVTVARYWLLVLIVFWVFGLSIGVAILANPGLLPEGMLRVSFQLFGEHMAKGEIQWARPDAKLSPDGSYWGIARVVAARLGYFFWFIASDYSDRHKLINVITVIPLYTLVSIPIIQMVCFPKMLSDQQRLIGILMIAFIGMFDVYHAITILDFDWRYRAPVYPALFVLAIIGSTSVVNWIKPRGKYNLCKTRSER